MRINMCAAIIVMQCVFLIGAHVKAQQVILKFSLPFSLCQMFCHYAHNGFNQNHLAVKRKNNSNEKLQKKNSDPQSRRFFYSLKLKKHKLPNACVIIVGHIPSL